MLGALEICQKVAAAANVANGSLLAANNPNGRGRPWANFGPVARARAKSTLFSPVASGGARRLGPEPGCGRSRGQSRGLATLRPLFLPLSLARELCPPAAKFRPPSKSSPRATQDPFAQPQADRLD